MSAPLLDRVPPQDIEAEMATLGACLMEREAIRRVRDVLSPSDFYLPAHRLLFATLCDLYDADKPVDIVTVCTALTEAGKLESVGGKSYLIRLMEPAPTAAAVEYYATIVAENSKYRALIDAANELREKAQRRDGDPATLCSATADALYRIGVSAKDDMLDFGRDVGRDTTDELERQMESDGRLLGVDTGIPSLNRYVPGWASGLLYLIAGRPAASKSAFALQQCCQAARDGRRVLFFSLEMPATMVGRRYLAHSLPKQLSRVMEARLSDDEFGRAASLFNEAYGWQFRLCETPGLTTSQLRARARTWAAKWGGVDLIAVDYLQLVEGDRRGENENARVGAISRGLKLLARETGAAVLALSQLNRDCDREKRWPRLSDLRDSGSLEQDADAVLFLHYPTWLVKQGAPDPDCRSITQWTEHMRGLYVAKNRNGRCLMTAMAWSGDYQRFTALESDRGEGHDYA